jgi:hypothetical protein
MHLGWLDSDDRIISGFMTHHKKEHYTPCNCNIYILGLAAAASWRIGGTHHRLNIEQVVDHYTS